MARNHLPTAEVYTIAADEAYFTASRYQHVRLNCMAVEGASALLLANVGEPLTDKTSADGEYQAREWLPDYVCNGALVSFRMLRNVIDHTARLVGPNNFKIIPCDSEGKTLAAPPVHTENGFESIIDRTHMFWLGDEREDYWHAVSVGIAKTIVGADVKPKKIRKIAEQRAINPIECNASAYSQLALAAHFTLEAVGATLHANDDTAALQSLHVKVEPTGELFSLLG